MGTFTNSHSVQGTLTFGSISFTGVVTLYETVDVRDGRAVLEGLLEADHAESPVPQGSTGTLCVAGDEDEEVVVTSQNWSAHADGTSWADIGFMSITNLSGRVSATP